MFKKGDVLKLSKEFFERCGNYEHYKHLDNHTRAVVLSDENEMGVVTDLYPNTHWSSWAFELEDDDHFHHKIKLTMSGNSLPV